MPVQKVPKVTVVDVGRKAIREQLDNLDQKEKWEKRVKRVLPDQKVLKERKGIKVELVCLVLKV